MADFFVSRNIAQVFCVVGGGAMHLNDSFGHRTDMRVLYQHHEQAAAMAAEAYARIAARPALLCVTSGPGAINALNGVAGAYQDSLPMIVVSGQVKSMMTVRYSGLDLRTLGPQEFDIVSALKNMTKYAKMITDAKKIRYCLEKAYHVAVTGRMGPCWLDVPLDVQGAYVDTDELRGFEPGENFSTENIYEAVTETAKAVSKAKRPVIYAGSGVRLAGAKDLLRELSHTAKIPVVTCWDSTDLVENDDGFFCGRGGTMGDRAGNFAVQNSDLLLAIGTRLNVYQVGYNVKTWARAAKTIVVDIDGEELKKPTIRVDVPICADAKIFLQSLNKTIKNIVPSRNDDWILQCQRWKEKYPVVRAEHYAAEGKVNVYAFMGKLSRMLDENAVVVAANGSASVVGSQSFFIKNNSRFILNCGISSMGYALPAAIGACVARGQKNVICIEGDGSIMMNLQELQTVVTNVLPIKIFIVNNGGYHQIRQTQNNIFHNGLIGVGPESGDLGFPDFEKIAAAFGLKYFRIDDNQKLEEGLGDVISFRGACVAEIFVTTEQKFEPKSAAKKLPDGRITSPPLEDMAPFLSREELAENMYIPLVDED